MWPGKHVTLCACECNFVWITQSDQTEHAIHLTVRLLCVCVALFYYQCSLTTVIHCLNLHTGPLGDQSSRLNTVCQYEHIIIITLVITGFRDDTAALDKTIMYFYKLLVLLISCINTCTTTREQHQQEERTHQQPNIVFILTDDQGWGDVGYHNPEVVTPNIDSLARRGVRLENYYVQPLCTPSRNQLLSGRHEVSAWLSDNGGQLCVVSINVWILLNCVRLSEYMYFANQVMVINCLHKI